MVATSWTPCQVCGAMVADNDLHISWHQSMKNLQPPTGVAIPDPPVGPDLEQSQSATTSTTSTTTP